MRRQLARTAPLAPPMTLAEMSEQIRAEGISLEAVLDRYIAGRRGLPERPRMSRVTSSVTSLVRRMDVTRTEVIVVLIVLGLLAAIAIVPWQ